ncbi:MAG: HD domain-containing phosphohydrolase, partial [Syntrophomonadaceae bacterium]|nr:HD domain-containing phosphohydrolase [Syntrophomonadaceae bacterium]
MRLLLIEELRPGMVLARSIYDDNFNLLLGSGYSLTPGVIEKLKAMGMNGVYIKDELISDSGVNEVLSDRIKSQALKSIKKSFKKAKMDSDIDYREVSKIVGIILDEVLSSSKILVELIDIRSKGNYYLSHSISVCAMAILTGISMNYNQMNLLDLGKGAMLHDIGLTRALNNDLGGPLSREGYLEHPAAGFEILRNIPEISTLSAHVAFQHHERHDGSGFPRGLSGEQIHPYAAITAVVDAYDSMVTPVEGRGLNPARALESIIMGSGRLYSPEVVLAFCKHIAPYPVGSIVKLNTGELAVVIHNHSSFRTRPVVKVISDRFGRVLSDAFP